MPRVCVGKEQRAHRPKGWFAQLEQRMVGLKLSESWSPAVQGHGDHLREFYLYYRALRSHVRVS